MFPLLPAESLPSVVQMGLAVISLLVAMLSVFLSRQG